MDPTTLTTQIKEEARRLGFDHCRVAAVSSAKHADFFDEWLERGYAGEMTYLTRNRDRRRDPALLAESPEVGAPQSRFRSIIVLAVNHYQLALPPHVVNDPSRGLIASYAWGADYHEIIKPQLFALDAFIRGRSGRQTMGKCLVDTGPVLERDWAQSTGLGFTGKNCCTIHPVDGSWLLLATILVPEVLVPDVPAQEAAVDEPTVAAVLTGLAPRGDYGRTHFAPEANGERPIVGTCGRCTRCLDGCPTAAFVGPYHLDPQRCISYWTIESSRPIPRSLRPEFGNRIFGCDVCQEVCPWNRRLDERTVKMAGLQPQSTRQAPPLLEGFAAESPYWLDQTAFSLRFRRSPIKRAKRSGMLRNVCVALGNWADPIVVPALLQALVDEAPLARGHAAWALGQVLRQAGLPRIRHHLEQRLLTEADAWVLEEIHLALST